MRLLYTSIKEDGYTQPIVTYHDTETDKYIIVDGFHRHLVMKLNNDIYELYQGLLPCVVIEKDINQRMASTIRHNRARGKHAVTGMSNMVMQMLMNGMSDEEICNKIGLEADELIRLKHLTGFSKLFKDVEYKKSWKHELMLKNEQKYNAQLKGNNTKNLGDKTVLEKSENTP